MQFIYTEGAGPINGFPPARGTPGISVDLPANDTLIGAFGTATREYTWSSRIWSVGFWSSSARQYGPYGGTGRGQNVVFNGNIWGIYGSGYSSGRWISSLGWYTDASSQPPQPPARPPPPPSPASPPAFNLGRVRSRPYGGARSASNGFTQFDDGPSNPRAVPLLKFALLLSFNQTSTVRSLAASVHVLWFDFVPPCLSPLPPA